MYIAPEMLVENMSVEDGLLLETSTATIEIEDGGWTREESDNPDWVLFQGDKLDL